MSDPLSLGACQLAGRLGAGGSGAVHEARDTRLGPDGRPQQRRFCQGSMLGDSG